MSKCIFSLLISTITVFASLDEQSVLKIALIQNPTIMSLNIQLNQDSLNFETIKSEWTPKLFLSIIPSINPLNKISGISPELANNSNASLELSTSVNSNIPGGGLLNFSFSNSIDSIPHIHNNLFSLNFKQPLLRNAWHYGELSYKTRIARLDMNQAYLERRKQCISLLSQIRSLFWNYYEQKSMLNIHTEELTRADYLQKIESAKFSIGESAPLDTLSAQLQYLNAQQSVLDATINMQNAHNELAFSLFLDPDSFSIKDSIDISVSDLPDVDSIIAMVDKYDPQMNLFDTLAEKILYDQKKAKNALLPSIDMESSISYSQSDRPLSKRIKSTNAVISCILSYSLPDRSNTLKIKSLTNTKLSNDIEKKKYRENLKLKVVNLKNAWKQELQRLHLLEKTCELSRQKLSVAQKQYEIGTIEQIVLLDAHKQLTDNEINLIDSKIKMKKLEVVLDELTGTIINKFRLDSAF